MSSAAQSACSFAWAHSTAASTADAVADVVRALQGKVATSPDLALVFATRDHAPELSELLPGLQQAVGAKHLLGCTGESLIAGPHELEGGPALVVWLAALPEAELHPFTLSWEETAEGGTFLGWPHSLPEPWPADGALLLLGDPFSFPAEELLKRLNEDQAGVPVVGGMASGGLGPGENRLYLDGQTLAQGAVAVLLRGAFRIRPVTSQGCRPIGRTFVITKAHANVIEQLGGQPALARLQEIFQGLTPDEQQLVRRGLHVGRVFNEFQGQFKRGDFLMRNVMGFDTQRGAIAIGDYVRVGQTVQFHIRDEASADEDLRELLQAARSSGPHAPAGALVFSCNGRGTRMFSQPDHDASVLQEVYGNLPVAGFFAQGELGPIGGRNYLHGFTASVVLFELGTREPGPARPEQSGN